MYSDMHTHSRLCHHAIGDPSDYVARATEIGMDIIACTDHCPVPLEYDPEHRMAMISFDEYTELVRFAQQREGIEVLFGVEADYFPGLEDFLSEWVPRQNFDIVLGSVHYILGPDNQIIAPQQCLRNGCQDPWEIWQQYYSFLLKMIQTGAADVIAHFDLPKKNGHIPSERITHRLAFPVLKEIARRGMALEINTSGYHHPIAEAYPSPQILEMAFDLGIPVTFGSDAHRPEHVAADFGAAIALARQVGYKEHVVFRRRRMYRVPLPET